MHLRLSTARASHHMPQPAGSTVTQAPASLDQVLAKARRLAKGVVAQEAIPSDEDAVWPEQSFRAAQAAGLAGLVVPVQSGGLGLGLEALLKVCQVFGHQSASFAISYGMHCVGTAVIAAKATPAHQDILRQIAAGRHITTLSLSEPGSGAHFYYPSTTATETATGYILSGTKSFVTNGGHADSYVMSTVAPRESGEPGLFSCFLVPASTPGLRWGEPYRGFGMRGNSARTVHLEDAPAPSEALLGEHGDELWYVFNVIAPYFLTAMAGTYLGIAERALHEAIGHLQGREYHHDGSRLSENAVLQHRIGTLWANVARTRQLAQWAAREADRGGPDALPALCSAKAEVADCAVDVTNDVMTLMGGQTYRDGSLLPRLLRDARAAHVMAPTTDILRTWTGRALLHLPLLSES